MPHFEIRSRDGIGRLALTRASGEDWWAELIGPGVTVRREVLRYSPHGQMDVLFASMAQDWRGWKGSKTWRSLDGEMSLECTSDGLGHVTVRVEIVAGSLYDWRTQGVLTVFKRVQPALGPLRDSNDLGGPRGFGRVLAAERQDEPAKRDDRDHPHRRHGVQYGARAISPSCTSGRDCSGSVLRQRSQAAVQARTSRATADTFQPGGQVSRAGTVRIVRPARSARRRMRARW